MNVCILEDDPGICLFVGTVFAASGADVYKFNRPEPFVRHVRENEDVDLLVTDIHLGTDMTGIDAAREIRSFSDVPILFHSSDLEALGSITLGRLRKAAVVEKRGDPDQLLQAALDLLDVEIVDAAQDSPA